MLKLSNISTLLKPDNVSNFAYFNYPAPIPNLNDYIKKGAIMDKFKSFKSIFLLKVINTN